MIAAMEFRATVELGGKTATGIAVPDRVVEALGSSRRPPVTVTINSHTYRTTVARMSERYMVSLSAENRSAAGVQAGDEVLVEMDRDDAPRAVELPADLAAALAANPTAESTYATCAPSHKKEWVRWITEAKRAETRGTRIEKAVQILGEGRKTR
jgi:bacteriocin resistance YdeI/OmpD-like protein/uncharacterized protein DUF1905